MYANEGYHYDYWFHNRVVSLLNYVTGDFKSKYAKF